MIWLGARQDVINPAFVAAADWPDSVTRWVHIGLIILGGISVARAATGGVSGFRRR